MLKFIGERNNNTQEACARCYDLGVWISLTPQGFGVAVRYTRFVLETLFWEN